MEEYTDYTPFLMRALTEQKMMIEDKPYTDEWGTVISAYGPFYNSKGEFVGVVGNDIDAEKFNARMLSVWLALGVGTLLSPLLSMLVFFVVWRIRTEHAHEERLRLSRLTDMHVFTEQMKKVASRVALASQDINARAQNVSKMAEESS